MTAFSEFFSKRTDSVADGRQYDRAVLLAIVDFLRSEEFLSSKDRRQMATHLHVLYLKQSPQELRDARKRMDHAVFEVTRDRLIKGFSAKGSKAPIAAADEVIVKLYPQMFASPDSFKKWMRRNRPKR